MSSNRLRHEVAFAILVAIAVAALFVGSAGPALASVCTLADHIRVCQHQHRRRLLPSRDEPRHYHHCRRRHLNRTAAADHKHNHD